MYKNFRNLILFILTNWNYLDMTVKKELVDTLTYYKDITIYSKYEREEKNVKNTITV